MPDRYEVRLLDTNRTPVAVVDTYTHLSWTRRWQKPGDFTFHLNRYSQAAQYIQQGNFLEVRRDGGREFVGIIRHRSLALDEQGKLSENWEVRGPDLGGILAGRIGLPPSGQSHDEQTDVTAEAALKHYVDANLINATDTARNVTDLSNAANQGRGNTISYRMRYQALVDALEEMALAGNIGWHITLTDTGFVFDVLEGVDKTAGQAVVPPIIFSPDFDNLRMLGYQESELTTRNLAYVAGQGEGAARAVEEVFTAATEPSGLTRREMFVDARDLDTAAKLQQRGKSKLEEIGPDIRLEAEILPEATFAYRDDWDLGDIVTVRNNEWGISADLRIMAVTLTLEGGRPPDIQATFGAAWPNFLTLVRRDIAASGPAQRI